MVAVVLVIVVIVVGMGVHGGAVYSCCSYMYVGGYSCRSCIGVTGVNVVSGVNGVSGGIMLLIVVVVLVDGLVGSNQLVSRRPSFPI